jgi:hypothetical protein
LQTLAFNKNCLCAWHKKHIPVELWDLALAATAKERCLISSENGRNQVLSGTGLFDPEKHMEYCKAPATDRQKDAASSTIKAFWSSLPREEKSKRATKASLEAAKKNRKKVILTFPDGLSKTLPSVTEAVNEAKMSTATFYRMLNKGVKSKSGFHARYVDG